jgi:hypothetical protein
MTTIYRKSASRLTVAEAKRLVSEAVPKEPAVDFFVAPDGSIKVELNHEANTAAPFINSDFLSACVELGINPKMTHRPVIAGYTGDGYQDVMYSITHDEFERYADLHGVAVTVGEAPSAEQAQRPEPVQPAPAAQVEPVQPPTPAGRTIETAEQRQARRYQMCLEAGLEMPHSDYGPWPRGISKVADKEGITRQSFRQDIGKHITRMAGKKQA